MRQLIFQVPRGEGQKVVKVAQKYKGINLSHFEAESASKPIDMAVVHIANSKVENLLLELESIPELKVTLAPQGVLALHPPPDEAPDQVTDVRQRSPLEVFLAGLQSVGSWWGFLSYSAVAGVVVWIGLFTNTNFLLVAAMLIAPFAGPAMNLAIAAARGDQKLLGRSLLRYFSAILLAVLVSALLSWILQQKIATQLMVDISEISSVSLLLPLAAGAAGAIHLIQSERSSLVSGAAVGLLVAASLAPPAGVVGMSLAMQRFDLMAGGVFLLLLQLAGINLAATLVFRMRGLTVQGARYQRGKKWIFPASLVFTAIGLGALLLWQFSDPPLLQRSSKSQRADFIIQKTMEGIDEVYLVESNASFPRPKIPGQHTLMCQVYAQKKSGTQLPDSTLKAMINDQLSLSLKEKLDVSPLVQVTLFEPPAQ
ncbi:MAG: DUF389 domain-containing protein [Cyclobacteriaceae bacterium]